MQPVRLRQAPLTAFTAFIGASALAAAAAPARAQDPLADLVLCDTTHDRLYRLTDFDSDGDYDSPAEVRLFQAPDDGIGNPRSVESRLEPGASAYWLDSALDRVWRGVDVNGDGDVDDAGESSVYRDVLGQQGPASPDGLELFVDGGFDTVWWCSNGGSVTGLFRLVDLDGDGDASSANESVQVLSGGSAFSAESDSGPHSMDTGALRRVSSYGTALLVSVEGLDEALYRVVDTNADGDLADAGEARLCLNASGVNPSLPQNPDFASGILRSLETPAPGGGTTYASLVHHAALQQGPVLLAFLGTDVDAGGSFALNVDGLGVNGVIFGARDINADGDVNDAGEVRLWYDGSVTSTGHQPIEQIVGLDALGSWLYVADQRETGLAVHRFRDLNSDGDALDTGEGEFSLFDFASYGLQAPFEFGGPFVYDLGALEAGPWNSFFSVSGSGCSEYGQVPFIAAQGHAVIGTAGFTAQAHNCPAGAIAVLWVGSSTTTWGGIQLPFDLTPLGYAGCTLYQDLFLTLFTAADANGLASFNLPLSFDPTVVGAAVPLQWAVINLLTPTPTSALTELGVVTIED